MLNLAGLVPGVGFAPWPGNADPRAISWPVDICVIDLETTGLDPSCDRIVEIGAVRVRDGQRERFQSLVNPGCPIPPQASAVHHITDDDVQSAPPIEQVIPALREFVGRSTVVAHHALHDAAFIAAATGSHVDPTGWLCTYRLAKHVHPLAPAHSNWALRYWLKVTPEPSAFSAHRALADALATVEVGLRLMQRCSERGMTGMADVIALANQPLPIRAMPFGAHAGTPIRELPLHFLQWALGVNRRKPGLPDIDPDLRFALERELATR